MLAFDQVPHQYFKPLNIHTGIEYHFDKDKFPDLTNIGHEPALVMAQTEMEKPASRPVENHLVPGNPKELPPRIKPENQSPENSTAYAPFTSYFGQSDENLSNAHYKAESQQQKQQKVLPRCQSVINQIPDQTELYRFKNQVRISKQISPDHDQQLSGPTDTNCPSSQTIQRRLSYGHSHQPESSALNFNQNRTRVEDVRIAPIPFDRNDHLQSDLLPSTVLSCLDPFDDSMSRFRTDGTFSGVSTPVQKTPENPENPISSYYQNVNTPHSQTQKGRSPALTVGSQDQPPAQNLQDVVQPSYISNGGTGARANTVLIPNNRSYYEKDGLPHELFTRPANHFSRPDRMATPTFHVRKHLQFHHLQHEPINPRVLAARRQMLSRKRSADNLQDFLAQKNKRPRREHVEIYGVEDGTHQTPASRTPNSGAFPTPSGVKLEDNSADTFDEYSCPARPKTETPKPTTQRHRTGTIHYYGATQSSANPLAKRFNPNFEQQKTTGVNTVNYPKPETNRSQFDVNLSVQSYSIPSSISLYRHTHDTSPQNLQTSGQLTHCPSQSIPRNLCVTKDTFLDILYAN